MWDLNVDVFCDLVKHKNNRHIFASEMIYVIQPEISYFWTLQYVLHLALFFDAGDILKYSQHNAGWKGCFTNGTEILVDYSDYFSDKEFINHLFIVYKLSCKAAREFRGI